MAFYALAGSSILATKYLFDYIYTPSTEGSTDGSTDGTTEYFKNESTDGSTEYSNNESKEYSNNESKEKSTENIIKNIKNKEEIDICEITPTLTPQSLAPLPFDKYRISHKKKND